MSADERPSDGFEDQNREADPGQPPGPGTAPPPGYSAGSGYPAGPAATPPQGQPGATAPQGPPQGQPPHPAGAYPAGPGDAAATQPWYGAGTPPQPGYPAGPATPPQYQPGGTTPQSPPQGQPGGTTPQSPPQGQPPYPPYPAGPAASQPGYPPYSGQPDSGQPGYPAGPGTAPQPDQARSPGAYAQPGYPASPGTTPQPGYPPYAGQPNPGQPNPGQQGYPAGPGDAAQPPYPYPGAPGTPRPGYPPYAGQPNPGQPGYPAGPGYPGYAPPRRRGPSRLWLWLAIIGTAIVAGAVVALVLGLGKTTSPRNAASSRSPSPHASPSASQGSPGVSMQIVSPAPDTAGILVHDRTAEQGMQSDLTQFLNLLQQACTATSPGVGAVYEQPGTQDPDTGTTKEILYIGLDCGVTNPASFLSSFLHTMSSGDTNIAFQPTAPGPGGGSAQCVTYFDSQTVQWSDCGWATSATVGIMLTPTRDYSVNQIADSMRQARPYFEHR